ncbi:acyl dehydratase [Phenylobacterium sp. Root77]|uniref:MaoC family dehydratase n=2 Tax=Phenylobacterium TaxID=20 RepID=UPI0006F3DE0D|nr:MULTISPECIES: MaoC family dehydratase [unclassified Phenylobacterium]KQW65569.1 acyl dehydratase [Phenylobacterium sp. Root1277]KQW95903.1 acyl dehydratase [Phenylobacterium sp. Root1290]KRC39014.1 acyl dehydratase [Phenylobacterium sp. Root77]
MTNTSDQSDGWAGTVRGKPGVGQVAERARTTRMGDIEAFSGITGDHNPLHYDRALAESTVFGKLIVQGGVTSGLLNACVAEVLPGPGTVFLSCDWKFLKAVGVDETITARVEVLTVRDDKPVCTLKTAILNEAGDICLEGTAATFTVPLMR